MLTPLLDWLTSPAVTAFGVDTTWAEVLGFITGAVCVLLVARQNIWNWPIGIANNVLWIVLFLSAGLYADSALQVVYIVLAIIGWYAWLHGGARRTELPVSRTTGRQWAMLAIALVAGTAFMTWLLATYTASVVPFWDAVTTVLSLLATWGQVAKKVESWYLWMLADIIYIPLYGYKDLWLTAILYVGFLALCIYGLAGWRRDLAGRAAAVTATAAHDDADEPDADKTPAGKP